MMYDVVSLGEFIIDFTPYSNPENKIVFEQKPGGAPCNLAAGVAKLGKKAAYIGKGGKGMFGDVCIETLEQAGVDTKGVVMTDACNTTLAFVKLLPSGDRRFSFYRNPGADMMLAFDEVDLSLIDNTKIFHFGSVSMTHEPARTATMEAAKYAKSKGKIISYDPNLRESLWPDLGTAKDVMLEAMQYADIVKISHEELEFLTGLTDLDQGSKLLMEQYGIKMMTITLAADGAYGRVGDNTVKLGAYDVKTIDTNGAGDSFFSGVLYKVLELGKPVDQVNAQELHDIIDFGNATGSITTTGKGAIPSMPTLEQVYDCIKNVPILK